MYKLLLVYKYLLSRRIALASVLSVTLGVATLVVVNAVMTGFATEMRERIRGILSDIVVEGGGIDGFPDVAGHMARIERAVGDKIAAMTPVVETFGLLSIDYMNQTQTIWVKIIGVDPVGKTRVGEFAEHLLYHRGPQPPSFDVPAPLREIERVFLQREGLVPDDWDSPSARLLPPQPVTSPSAVRGGVAPAEHQQQTDGYLDPNPFDDGPETEPAGAAATDAPLDFDHAPADASMGIVVPYLAVAYRDPVTKQDRILLPRGCPVRLVVPGSGKRPRPRFARFVIVDYFKSGMSEYDQTNCYVHIDDLRRLRGMGDRATSIQIKLKDYADAPYVVRTLRQIFPPGLYRIATWEELQGPLLAAVDTERRILTLLLFLIIAVAGFGILAIFSLIVVEKTRDIGILKALGASDAGIQGIFLGYGLALGAVGSAVGTFLGLQIVWNIDRIEHWMSVWTGREIFDRNLYYFDRIPTVVEPQTVALVAFGATMIALLASVWPARRAARLRTVEALRHE